MVVNQDHVESILRQIGGDAGPDQIRENIATVDDYIAAGRTYKDPGTGENVSVESLAEVLRALNERLDELQVKRG
jgi:hypothetical protein